jgi:hypothetical protein
MTVQRPLRSLSLARASALSQTGGGQDWHLAHKFIIFQLVILPHFYFQCGVVLFDILCVCVCVCVCVCKCACSHVAARIYCACVHAQMGGTDLQCHVYAQTGLMIWPCTAQRQNHAYSLSLASISLQYIDSAIRYARTQRIKPAR